MLEWTCLLESESRHVCEYFYPWAYVKTVIGSIYDKGLVYAASHSLFLMNSIYSSFSKFSAKSIFSICRFPHFSHFDTVVSKLVAYISSVVSYHIQHIPYKI